MSDAPNRQPVVFRYRDGRMDRGYVYAVVGGVVRGEILRGSQGIEAALPISLIECLHFVVDLQRGPLESSARARPLPGGKTLEVHLSTWSIKGVRTEHDELGFSMVPTDPCCNSVRIYFPSDAPSLVETADLPRVPPSSEEEFSDADAESLLSSVDLDLPAMAARAAPRPSAPQGPSVGRGASPHPAESSESLVPPTLASMLDDTIDPSRTPAQPLSVYDLRERPGESAGQIGELGRGARIPVPPEARPRPPPPPSVDPFAGQWSQGSIPVPMTEEVPADHGARDLETVVIEPPVEMKPEELLTAGQVPSVPPNHADLPPLAALVPPGADDGPLTPSEVAELIGVASPATGSVPSPPPAPADAMPDWADPWSRASVSEPSGSTPDMLLPFPTLDLPKRAPPPPPPPSKSVPPIPSARAVEPSDSASVPPPDSAVDDPIRAFLDSDF